MPVTPHSAAGWRIEPPVSVPVAAGTRRAATAAAEPPEEPPGHERRVPGIAHRAVVARLVGRAHRELVHVGLAEHDGAGGLEPRDHGGVVGRDEVVEHPRAAGGAHARGAEDVLVRDRHAGQRAAARRRPARGRRPRRRASACSRVTVMKALSCRLAALDALQEGARQLDAREAAARAARRRARRACCDAVAHGASLDDLRHEVQARPPPAAHCAGTARGDRVSVTTSGRRRCESPGSGCAIGATPAVSARIELADEIEDAREAVAGRPGSRPRLRSRRARCGDALDLLAGQGHRRFAMRVGTAKTSRKIIHCCLAECPVGC